MPRLSILWLPLKERRLGELRFGLFDAVEDVFVRGAIRAALHRSVAAVLCAFRLGEPCGFCTWVTANACSWRPDINNDVARR